MSRNNHHEVCGNCHQPVCMCQPMEIINALRQQLAHATQRAEKAERFIADEGYRLCDVMRCNCGSWHAAEGWYARFRDIEKATQEDWQNGETLIARVKRIVSERDAARARIAELENVLRAIGQCLPFLKPVGHDGDEESGEHEPDCARCAWDQIDAAMHLPHDAALASPTAKRDAEEYAKWQEEQWGLPESTQPDAERPTDAEVEKICDRIAGAWTLTQPQAKTLADVVRRLLAYTKHIEKELGVANHAVRRIRADKDRHAEALEGTNNLYEELRERAEAAAVDRDRYARMVLDREERIAQLEAQLSEKEKLYQDIYDCFLGSQAERDQLRAQLAKQDDQSHGAVRQGSSAHWPTHHGHVYSNGTISVCIECVRREGIAEGIRIERARVVADLREQLLPQRGLHSLRDLANRYERGEHAAEGGE